MRLENIALHNLRRRKGRAAFLMTGLLIGVATVITLLSLGESMTHHIEMEMETFGANIIITPHRDQLDLSYGGIQLGGVSLIADEIRQENLSAIDSIPNRGNVAAIAPKVLGTVEAGGQRLMLMGIDPKIEFGLKRWWTLQGERPGDGPELVVGSVIAQKLNLKTGQTLQVNDRDFTVVGMLEQTGSQDDQLLLTSIPMAQELLGKAGSLSMVEVAALCHDCPVEDMVNQLRTALPNVDVQAVQQVVKSRMHALEQFRMFAWGVAGTVVIIGALLVFVTMMGSVNERTREIGIFRAIGYRRSHVLRLILIEAGLVSALAGVLGYFAGIGATMVALPLLKAGNAGLHLNPTLAAGAFVATMVVGLLATLLPALRASRLDPSEALRAL